MSILEKKTKFWKINKINNNNFGDNLIIEVCEPTSCLNFVPIYRELLQSVLSNWMYISASQVINIREFTTKELFNLLSIIINDHTISIAMTKSMIDPQIPKEFENNFAIHIFSCNTVNWIPPFIRYGSVSLPHIGYCSNEINEIRDIRSLCKTNADFENWFQLSTNEKLICKLREKASLIYWVADFRIYFFSSQEIINSAVDEILRIGQNNDLRIVL